jgi:glycosyltransferase involved in cell wall biosynthesis
MVNNITVSVVIPALNEERHIALCLQSIIDSEYATEKFEIIIVDGNSSDTTVSIANRFKDEFNHFKVIQNPKKITPVAFNLGIKEAKGDYILILSAHSVISTDYISGLVHAMESLGADLVGGTFDVQAKKDTKFSRAIKNVLRSKWGAGTSKSRVGVKEATEADTASGMYRASIFDKVGLFDERLLRNQDIELSKRIKNSGGKIFVIPDVSYTYYCRDSLTEFIKQSIKNGYWVINTGKIIGFSNSISFRHLVPLYFALAIIMTPVIILTLPTSFALLYCSAFVPYLVLIGKESILRNSAPFIYNLITFISLHLSYGVGSILRLVGLKLY